MRLFGRKPNIKKLEAKKDVKGLIEVLKSEKGRLLQKTAEALLEKGDIGAAEFLAQEVGLIGKGRYALGEAVEALGKIGGPAVEPLIRELKDKSSDVLGEAVEALGKIGGPAVEPLIQELKDKSSVVRGRAAEALGLIKDARAVEPLTEALKDKDKYVRKATKEALKEIKVKKS